MTARPPPLPMTKTNGIGDLRAAASQAREEITELVADRPPLCFPLRCSLLHSGHIELVKDSGVCLKSQEVPVLEPNGRKRVVAQLKMQHHRRSIKICPFAIDDRAPDQQ